VGSASTVGQLPRGDRLSGSLEDEDSLGEFGDGTASLHAQVRALQADLADKTRYCQTLEKRLLQARRSSHSRTSVNFSKGGGIMVGEDHGVAALLKDKDAEIAELRARLDDKDRMLDALRSAARSRDTADRDPRAPKAEAEPAAAAGAGAAAAAAAARPSLPLEAGVATEGATASPVASLLATKARARRRSVDEMSRMLDEMIQDRVERGDMVRGARGSVRLASERRQASLGHSATTPRPMPLSHEAPS
jgi:centromeric protein E